MIIAECTEAGKIWKIMRGSDAVGTVERFATGYMLTLHRDPPQKIKRFRMIDALRQAFGEAEEIKIEQEPGE